MIRPRRNTRLLGVVGALCALAAAPAAHAQLVTALITPNGPLFHYNYTITNNTPNDLIDLTIHVAPGVGTVLNLSAPGDFTPNYDSGLGLVDFLEGATSQFTATPVSGFQFDSPLRQQPSSFDASLFDGTSINTTSGPTPAPRAAAVPESGTLALALLAVPALLLFARRRRAPLIPVPLMQGDHTR